MLTIVSYDIVKDKPRMKLHKYLKEMGLNTQKSVFECEVNAKVQRRIVAKGIELIDEKTDSIRMYSICDRCARKVQVQGLGVVILPRTFEVV